MNKDSTRAFSSRQEKQIAKILKGRTQPNSGAANFVAGDVKTDHCLIDAKTVMKPQKSVTIMKDWLLKIREEAFAMRKDFGVIAFNFGPGEPNYYTVDEPTFIEMLKLYEESMKNDIV